MQVRVRFSPKGLGGLALQEVLSGKSHHLRDGFRFHLPGLEVIRKEDLKEKCKTKVSTSRWAVNVMSWVLLVRVTRRNYILF